MFPTRQQGTLSKDGRIIGLDLVQHAFHGNGRGDIPLTEVVTVFGGLHESIRKIQDTKGLPLRQILIKTGGVTKDATHVDDAGCIPIRQGLIEVCGVPKGSHHTGHALGIPTGTDIGRIAPRTLIKHAIQIGGGTHIPTTQLFTRVEGCFVSKQVGKVRDQRHVPGIHGPTIFGCQLCIVGILIDI